MQFKAEQIALCPRDPDAARKLLDAMGITDWVFDHVSADGYVKCFNDPAHNEGDLAYNYQALSEARELEILHYSTGPNWMSNSAPRISHLGMHCTEPELHDWLLFFSSRGIKIAQEVRTSAHTNPAIAGKRKYHYVIFDTYDILGVDVKFIVRHDPSDF